MCLDRAAVLERSCLQRERPRRGRDIGYEVITRHQFVSARRATTTLVVHSATCGNGTGRPSDLREHDVQAIVRVVFGESRDDCLAASSVAGAGHFVGHVRALRVRVLVCRVRTRGKHYVIRICVKQIALEGIDQHAVIGE